MIRWTRSRRLLLCAGIAALLYLVGLGRPALWEPDEGRYAEVAREMVVSGDYVTPRNDWVRYFEKPPLVYWATAASLKIIGENEFAVRLQASLFSIGQVVITAALAETIFGPAAGLLAALALALSPLFFAFARFATPDPALAFWMTAALACFYSASRAWEIGTGSGRLWMIAAAAALAMGTLSKGPVALVLSGGIALGWLLFERRARDALKVPWIAAGLVYLAIVVPWFWLVARRNPGFLDFFFVHEHLDRYLTNAEHGWGPWFFIPVVIGGTWPWCTFVPLGISSIVQDQTGDGSARRQALSFLLIWFGLIFIFFSIPRSKLGEYMLPGLPPIAIIAGYGLASLETVPAWIARRSLLSLLILSGLLEIGVGIAALVAFDRATYPTLATDAAIGTSMLTVAAAAAYLLSRNKANRTAVALSIAAGSLALAIVMMKAREDAASIYSYRSLARTIAPLAKEGCVVASYKHHIQSLPFYTGVRERLVLYRGELAPFSNSADAKDSFVATNEQLRAIWSNNNCVVLIANRNDINPLVDFLRPTPSIIGCEGKKFALLNHPGSSLSATLRACRSSIQALLP
jgi:4-amino-4-deoxy-L-arabinose transferase-like glycosyltransferase